MPSFLAVARRAIRSSDGLFARDDPGIASAHPATRACQNCPRKSGNPQPQLLVADGIAAPASSPNRPSWSWVVDFRFQVSNSGGMRVRIPAARMASGLCVACRPRRDEGAGKTGCTLHPRSRVQLRTEDAHTSIQVQAEHPGLPCAVALRLTSCSPRRTALLPPSPPRSFASLGLNASTATSGPLDFAVRIRRLRLVRHQRPPHPTARS